MMGRQYLLGLLFLLATSVARAQEQAPPSAAPAPEAPEAPAAASEPAPPPAAAPEPAAAAAAAPSQPAPPPATKPPALTAHEQRQLIEGRQQLLRDRRFRDEPDEPVERRASAEQARPDFSLALSLDSLFQDDPGYDLFDDDDVSSRFGLWASYDVARLAPRLALAIELGGGFETHEQDIWDDQLQSELDSQTFSAGVSLRYDLLSWLAPQLRAAGGVSLFQFELAGGADVEFEDDAVSGFGSLGAGVLLHTPERLFENKQGGFASFEIGFLIEGGYALRSPVEFELEHEASALAIPLEQASLGELTLAGPYIRSSLLVRF